MPRVLNVMLAAVFLLLVGPIVTNFDGKPLYVQAALVMVALPFLLLTLACLASAARPGCLGRALRRGRQRRGSSSSGS